MQIVEFSPQYLAPLRQLYLEARRATFTWLDSSHYQLSDFDRDTQGEKIYLAVDAQQLLGFIAIWQQDSFVHHLYVTPASQRCGVGKKLLAKARAEHATLSLKCMTHNRKAIGFYQSQGFNVVSHHDSDDGGYELMSTQQRQQEP